MEDMLAKNDLDDLNQPARDLSVLLVRCLSLARAVDATAVLKEDVRASSDRVLVLVISNASPDRFADQWSRLTLSLCILLSVL